MQNFNNFYGQPMYGNQMGGMVYNMPAQKKIACNNPLTKEQLSLLQNKGDKLQLSLTDVEVAKAVCTHKKDGRIMLMKDPVNPNLVTCSICGETFELTDGDSATIEAVCNLMTNVFQTMKTYWLDVPDQVAQNFYTVLPLIKKIPAVYNLACKNFNQVENFNNMTEANQPYGFNMFANIMNPQMAMGMYQQPMGMYPQQNSNMAFPNPIGGPAYQQAPMGYVPQPGYVPNPVNMPQANYGAPYQQDMTGGNPFGYNGAPVAQQPAPAATTAPAQPAAEAPAAPATAVNEKVFSI